MLLLCSSDTHDHKPNQESTYLFAISLSSGLCYTGGEGHEVTHSQASIEYGTGTQYAAAHVL